MVKSATIIADEAKDIVNSKDNEGNSAHMLTFIHSHGISCRKELGKKDTKQCGKR